MARAVLALGSNLGDRRAHLQRAVAVMPDLIGVSDLYETDPIGGVEGRRTYAELMRWNATQLLEALE